MKMNKQGISPVIGVLLLIGLAVVISLIIVSVFGGFIEEKCELSNQACELLCEKVKLESSYSNGKLYITNLGNIPIYNIEIRISSEGGYETKNILEISVGNWTSTGLLPGKVFSESIDIGDASKTVLIPILMGDNKKTYNCEGRFEKRIS